jgi:diketogulonate reductase-like aldo/keto reductase
MEKRRLASTLIAVVVCILWIVNIHGFPVVIPLPKRWTATASLTKRFSTENIIGVDERRIEFVDFWGVQHRSNSEKESQYLPVDRNLDRYDGPLPPMAYVQHGNPQWDPKQTCRITLSLDWHQSQSRFSRRPLDNDQVIRQVHRCLDSGFQSFQLGHPDETAMIGRLQTATPKFVEMQWTVQLKLPKNFSPKIVRESVLDLIQTSQMDALDALLVVYDADILPQYYMETLDVLQDMQRDGYIRSIGALNWPDALIQQAFNYGFGIDLHQRNGNILLPPAQFTTAHETLQAPADVWTDPLVSNILSNNFLFSRNPPTYSKGWKDVRTWHGMKSPKHTSQQDAALISDSKVWTGFQKDVLSTLQDISRKHEVSIATIVLRWSLQEKEHQKDKGIHASNVLYPLTLVEEPENHLSKELCGLRDVFRFSLDEDDLHLMESISAQRKSKPTTMRIDDVEVNINDIPLAFLKEFESLNGNHDYNNHDDDEGEKEYPSIDFNNRALWL